MMFNLREKVLVLFIAGILGLTLLAGSIGRLHLRSAAPNDPRFIGELLAFREFITSPRTLILLLTCLIPFMILTAYLLLASESQRRKQRQKRSVVLEAFLWMLAFAALRLFLEGGMRGAQNGEEDFGDVLHLPDIPIISFTPQVSNTASIVTGFLLLLLVIAAGWLLWRRLHPPSLLLEQIGTQAEAALEELRSGGNFRNTILRCYAEMCQVLNRERGIQRDRGMTPREFEQHLQQAGLPAEPVRRLTRLFERVRYGATEPLPEEEREAFACLEDIASAVGGLG